MTTRLQMRVIARNYFDVVKVDDAQMDEWISLAANDLSKTFPFKRTQTGTLTAQSSITVSQVVVESMYLLIGSTYWKKHDLNDDFYNTANYHFAAIQSDNSTEIRLNQNATGSYSFIYRGTIQNMTADSDLVCSHHHEHLIMLYIAYLFCQRALSTAVIAAAVDAKVAILSRAVAQTYAWYQNAVAKTKTAWNEYLAVNPYEAL